MKLMKKQIIIIGLLLVFVFATSSITLTHVNGLVNDNPDYELSITGLHNEDFDFETYKDPATTAWGWGTGALTNTRDFSWALLDFYNTPFPARGIDVQGRKVYVVQYDGSSHFHTIGAYSINNPSDILLLSERDSLDRTLAIAVDGDVGYTGRDSLGQTFNTYNISRPYELDGSGVYYDYIDKDGTVTDIDPEGYLVYYTVYNSASDRSFQIANAANPSNLIEINPNWNSNMALGLEVEGHFAYIAASTDGLYILNVSNKYSPVEIGYLGLPGNATDVILDGNFAYVSCGAAGVALVDVSNPTLPVLKDMYDTIGISSQMVLQGNTLFVADGSGGVCVLDVASHDHLTYVTKMPLPYVWDVDLYGGILVVASDDGIHTFRICAGPGITDFSQSYYVNAFTGLQAWDVRVLGDIAYVAGGPDGFYTLDVSDPNNPILLDHVTPVGGNFRKLDVEGTFAHLIADGAYYIYNIQDPANIKQEGYISGNQLLDVFVAGDLVYISWQQGGYVVLNVTHPNLLSTPHVLHEPHFGTNITALWVQGPHVYLVDGSELFEPTVSVYQTLDLTNQVLADNINSWGRYYDIKVDGDIAYTSDRDWLVLYNVTDPYGIWWINDVFVNAQYLHSYGVWNFGPYVMNAAGSQGVHLVDTTDFGNYQATNYADATGALQVSSYGDYTYVANMSSLVILRHFESAGDTYIPGTVMAQSTKVSTAIGVEITDAILSADVLDLLSSSYEFLLSADGGLHWEAVIPDVSHVFAFPGDDLRWRVELTGLSDRSDHIYSIHINYNYDTVPVVPEFANQIASIGFALLFISIFVATISIFRKKKQLKK